MRVEARLWGLAALFALAALGYMLLAARGSWDFLLPFRAAKLAALCLSALAVSTATVLFQSITRNRILTPSVMGFDALYVLIVTMGVYLMGGPAFAALPEEGLFLVTLAALIVAALLLFGTLLLQERGDLMRLVLTVLFRSLTGFATRMIDPNEYSIIQVASFASFSRIETDLLGLSVLLIGLVLARVWVIRHRLDVLALGREAAVNLGEDPKSGTIEVLILVAVLVSVSTAFVGPIAFLGLLVVSLAHVITPTGGHGVLLVSSALVAGLTLVGGQTILERLLGLATPLTVVVDVAGGMLFLVLVLKEAKR